MTDDGGSGGEYFASIKRRLDRAVEKGGAEDAAFGGNTAPGSETEPICVASQSAGEADQTELRDPRSAFVASRRF
jgi:hypothetical protein